MKDIVRIPISILVLMLAAPAFANTPADNVAWSAKPVQAVASSPDCTAYSGRLISSGAPLSTETVLKSVGTALAVSALSVTAGLLGGSSTQSVRACRPADGL